ncbi:MAG: hypothetical protein ACYDBQ_12560, partial [Thermoplasmatota archaeon]
VSVGVAALAVAAVLYAALLPVLGRQANRGVRRGLNVNVLLLFVGMYLLTAGLRDWFPPSWVPRLGSPASALAVTTILSNTVGNVPATLTLLRLDPAWTVAHAMFLVTVTTLGGALLLTGSAASLLAADAARRMGIEVRFGAFFRHAAWVLPLLVVGAWKTW